MKENPIPNLEPPDPISREEILRWLREDDPNLLEKLWRRADEVRRRTVGNSVHLRGLLEISNHCIRSCRYCGLNVQHADLQRYRMSEEEILDCARQAVGFGYGTVVMQAGEDYGLTTEFITRIVRRIKTETPLAVTLSLGERGDRELAAWREAGADRYLLRFETSDRRLYDRIHPSLPQRRSDRFAILHTLRDLGYEVGSGVMIGIPGQSFDSLANDIETFRELDLDMIGNGPYLSHPATPLGREAGSVGVLSADQVPNTELIAYKLIALSRLVCPYSNIPSTTALATLNLETGRELGLARGANVIMPNVTSGEYRGLYEIYPAKACINETSQACHACLQNRIETMGRIIGTGPGPSLRWEFFNRQALRKE